MVAPHYDRRGGWTIPLVSDGLAYGLRFRCLNVVDDYTRECLAIEVDTSLPGLRVQQVLERLKEMRGLPASITVDNGPEFAGKVLDAWAYEAGVTLSFIRPGKPVENAYIESFNGRFRDECLNEHWFVSMRHAKRLIEEWRIEYNTERPHSSLGYLTPVQFAYLPGSRRKATGAIGGLAVSEFSANYLKEMTWIVNYARPIEISIWDTGVKDDGHFATRAHVRIDVSRWCAARSHAGCLRWRR
ncbi:transposase family protein [Burkholderia cenocepacia]|nr:transposase family protein [Burkholderia cenocepacia]